MGQAGMKRFSALCRLSTATTPSCAESSPKFRKSSACFPCVWKREDQERPTPTAVTFDAPSLLQRSGGRSHTEPHSLWPERTAERYALSGCRWPIVRVKVFHGIRACPLGARVKMVSACFLFVNEGSRQRCESVHLSHLLSLSGS